MLPLLIAIACTPPDRKADPEIDRTVSGEIDSVDTGLDSADTGVDTSMTCEEAWEEYPNARPMFWADAQLGWDSTLGEQAVRPFDFQGGIEVEPYVKFTVMDFDAYRSCNWTGLLRDVVVEEALGEEWARVTGTLEFFAHDCPSWVSCVTIGTEDPSDHLDGMRVGLVWGEPTTSFHSTMNQYFWGSDEDWNDYYDYAFPSWILLPGADGELTGSISDFSYAHEVDSDFEMQGIDVSDAIESEYMPLEQMVVSIQSFMAWDIGVLVP